MNSCIGHNLRTFEGGISGNGSKEDSDSDDEEALTKRLVRQASKKNFLLFMSPLYQAWCVYYYRYKVYNYIHESFFANSKVLVFFTHLLFLYVITVDLIFLIHFQMMEEKFLDDASPASPSHNSRPTNETHIDGIHKSKVTPIPAYYSLSIAESG